MKKLLLLNTMKKLLLILLCVPLLFSCGENNEEKKDKIKESTKDIDVNKIDNACDYVDAVGVVTGEMIDLKEEYKDTDKEDIPKSAFKKMESLKEKLKSVHNEVKDEWIDEIKDCPNFNKVDENMGMIDDIEHNQSKLCR